MRGLLPGENRLRISSLFSMICVDLTDVCDPRALLSFCCYDLIYISSFTDFDDYYLFEKSILFY